MATLIKTGLNICEIDSEYKSQTNTGDCDCGNYGSKVNNCFFNFDSINDEIPSGSVISSAILQVAQVGGNAYSHNQNINVSLRPGDWAAFSWNTQPADIGAGDIQVSLSGDSSGNRSFDITALIQWLVNNNSAAHIFKFERAPNDTSGSDDAKRFSTTASKHQLQITYTSPTAPSSPTGISLSQNPFESALSISWAKGADGFNNPITGHEVRYQSSDDGWNWSGETVIGLDASATNYGIPQSILNAYSRGKYIRARVGSQSTYAGTVYSDFCAAVRKNRTPYTPTGASVDKTSYVPGDTVKITFTNNGDPDNNLSGFEAAMKDAQGNWYGPPTIVGSAAGASVASINIATNGWAQSSQWKFYIRGYDALGVRGDWSAPTALITMNTAPLDPEITYPAAGSTVYNKRPHILLKAAATNDGPKHTLCLNDGTEKTTADGTGFSCGANDNLASGRQVVYIPTADMATGNKSVTARMYDSYLYSPGISRTFSIATFTPEDADLTITGMFIKAAMITELQTAIGNLLSAYGLQAVNWTSCIWLQTSIAAATTLIGELQNAMQSIINRINGWDSGTSTGDISVTWISPAVAGGGVDPIKLRQAIEQLRSIITQI